MKDELWPMPHEVELRYEWPIGSPTPAQVARFHEATMSDGEVRGTFVPNAIDVTWRVHSVTMERLRDDAYRASIRLYRVVP